MIGKVLFIRLILNQVGGACSCMAIDKIENKPKNLV